MKVRNTGTGTRRKVVAVSLLRAIILSLEGIEQWAFVCCRSSKRASFFHQEQAKAKGKATEGKASQPAGSKPASNERSTSRSCVFSFSRKTRNIRLWTCGFRSCWEQSFVSFCVILSFSNNNDSYLYLSRLATRPTFLRTCLGGYVFLSPEISTCLNSTRRCYRTLWSWNVP